VRTVIAAVLLVTVQGAALTAPFVHAHPDDHATAHHNGRSVHSHWAGHTHSTDATHLPAFVADDHDRATFLSSFVGVAVSAMATPVVAPQPFALPIPAERRAHRPVSIAHSHDPPTAVALPSRAPPAFLS
jgi:hypothetical protein